MPVHREVHSTWRKFPHSLLFPHGPTPEFPHCLGTGLHAAGIVLIDNDVHGRDQGPIPTLLSLASHTAASLPPFSTGPALSAAGGPGFIGTGRRAHPSSLSLHRALWHTCFPCACAILCHWQGMFPATPVMFSFNDVFHPFFIVSVS